MLYEDIITTAALVISICSVLVTLSVYARLLKIYRLITSKSKLTTYVSLKAKLLKRFGDFLVEQGLISRIESERILKMQSEEDQLLNLKTYRFGEVAVKLGILTEKELEESLAAFLSSKEL